MRPLRGLFAGKVKKSDEKYDPAREKTNNIVFI